MVHNPYYDQFHELLDKDSFRAQTWFGSRQELVEKYGWAIPNREAIRYCQQFDEILDVGAGGGYWAYCIGQDDETDVHPVDKSPPSKPWVNVAEKRALSVFEKMEEMPVLMVWPPYNESMASRVVGREPDNILYVGERRGGCTANDEFFDRIEEQYAEVTCIDIPSYNGIHDNFYHFGRKA